MISKELDPDWLDWLEHHTKGADIIDRDDMLRLIIAARRLAEVEAERDALRQQRDNAEQERDSEFFAKEEYAEAMERQIACAEKAEAERDALKEELNAHKEKWERELQSLLATRCENARLRDAAEQAKDTLLQCQSSIVDWSTGVNRRLLEQVGKDIKKLADALKEQDT